MLTYSIGRDVKLPSELRPVKGAIDHDAFEALERTGKLGLDGVLFRTLYELSPGLDQGRLTELAEHAAALGQYVEVGVGKVNPFMTLELPEIRTLGAGSYLTGMERLIQAAALLGWTELWSAMANYKGHIGGLFANDRYRTDVDWPDQLAATTRFLGQLAPCLRDCGAHLNLETHEEVTTDELVRIVETVGPDVVGITFDTANVVVHGEDPLAAAARVAPYVRMAHFRDVALFATEAGITRYLAPCGEGVIDWRELIAVLRRAGAAPNLTIEVGAGRTQPPMHAYVDDPRWQAAHPDLRAAEIARLRIRADEYQRGAGGPRRPTLADYRAGVAESGEDFLLRSAAHLRDCLADLDAAEPAHD